MKKIIVSVQHPVSEEKRVAIVTRIAGSLGVQADDVVLLTDGVSVSVVDIPDFCQVRESMTDIDVE